MRARLRVPGGVAQFGGDEDAIVRLTSQVRRSEVERLLGEVRPRCDRAAESCGPSGVLEDRSDLCVRTLGRQRQVPRPFLSIDNDGGQPAMHDLLRPSRHSRKVDRREQGMREPDPVALELDHACLDSSLEVSLRAIGRANREHHHRHRRTSQRSCKPERRRRRPRKQSESSADELAQIRRNRKRLSRHQLRSCPLERARELEREERVALGQLMNGEKCGAREIHVEMHANELVEPRDGQRAESEMLDSIASERTGQLARLGLVGGDPDGRQDADRLGLQPPARELEHTSRRWVEPLNVVDGDEHCRSVREDPHAGEESGCDRAIVGRDAVRIFKQERELECMSLRRRELRQHVNNEPIQQIGQTCERQPHLGAARLGQENSAPPRRARSTPSRQTRVFPIPASPSRNSAHGPMPTRVRNSSRLASSACLPISVSTLVGRDIADLTVACSHLI